MLEAKQLRTATQTAQPQQVETAKRVVRARQAERARQAAKERLAEKAKRGVKVKQAAKERLEAKAPPRSEGGDSWAECKIRTHTPAIIIIIYVQISSTIERVTS
jgi:hypothetical protein